MDHIRQLIRSRQRVHHDPVLQFFPGSFQGDIDILHFHGSCGCQRRHARQNFTYTYIHIYIYIYVYMYICIYSLSNGLHSFFSVYILVWALFWTLPWAHTQLQSPKPFLTFGSGTQRLIIFTVLQVYINGFPACNLYKSLAQVCILFSHVNCKRVSQVCIYMYI